MDLLDDSDDTVDHDSAFLFDDISDGPGADATETSKQPSARSLRMQARRAILKVEREERLGELLSGPPRRGEQIHVVSTAKFDFWTWVPVMIDWLGTTDHLFCSTWTLSRGNAKELFELWDRGKIAPQRVAMLTGTYFKRRETHVYAYLLENLRRRGGRYRAFANHAKVLLLASAKRKTWLTIESSANLTSNPRLEQYVITNDRRLHDFHAAWMEEMLAAPAREAEDF